MERAIDGDGDGDLLGRNTATNQWQLSRTQQQHDRAEQFIYDGLRPERGNAGDHLVLAFLDSDGCGPQSSELHQRFVYGPNVDQILAVEQIGPATGSSTVYWPLADHLGTVRDIAVYDSATSTTTVINHIIYDSYGNITSETGPATGLAPTEASILAGDFPFAFTGREFDAETPDLMYYRARYYITTLGSWISNDPIGFGGRDTNLRRYVRNSSTNANDPTGLRDLWWWWYYHGYGNKLNLNERAYRPILNVLQNSEETTRAKEQITERAREGVIAYGTRQGPNRSGGWRTAELTEHPAYAGGRVRTLVGGAAEVIAGQPFSRGDPDVSGTTLYAQGDSTIVGVGDFVWWTGPIVTRYKGRERYRTDVRTTCVDGVYEHGFWVYVNGNVNFELVDRFADPLDLLDMVNGEQEIPGGVAYDIGADLGSQPVTARRFVVLEETRERAMTSCDCRR